MRAVVVLVADLVCVLVFATVGRASHAEHLDLAGVALVAWPFLAGCVLGTVVATLLRRRPVSVPAGLVVWAATLVAGMVLRAATGGGVEVSFVIVAGVVLAAFFLGWRVVVAAGRRARQARRERLGSARLS